MYMTKSILCFFRLGFYAEGESADNVSGDNSQIPEGIVGGNDDQQNADDINTYIGSKEVNPDQLPLKKFDRSFYTTKEEIDAFIKETGKDLFLQKQQQAEEEQPDKNKDKDGKYEEGGKEDAEADEKAADEFLKDIGITKEVFLSLPEKAQERLVAEQTDNGNKSAEYESISKKHTELVSEIKELRKDPVIAARLEEKRTGKEYVARDLPAITKNEVNKLIELSDDSEEFSTAINELITKKAHDVLKIERGIVERMAKKEQAENEAAKILQSVIDKEPRFGITEKDITKIDEDHPEYDKLFGKDGIMEELKKRRYSPLQLIAKGADELLREIATSKGWDKEDQKKVYKNGQKSILDTLRKAKTVARTLEVGKKSLGKNVDSSRGFDRDTLISDIASGKTTQWLKLVSEAENRGDMKTVAQLTAMYDDALRDGKTT